MASRRSPRPAGRRARAVARAPPRPSRKIGRPVRESPAAGPRRAARRISRASCLTFNSSAPRCPRPQKILDGDTRQLAHTKLRGG